MPTQKPHSRAKQSNQGGLRIKIYFIAAYTVFSSYFLWQIISGGRTGKTDLLAAITKSDSATITAIATSSIASVLSSPILPKRLILVVGLESSGTKYLTKSIAIAAGAVNPDDPGDYHGRKDELKHSSGIEVQHISLPFSSKCTTAEYSGRPVTKNFLMHSFTMQFIPPRECGFCGTKKGEHNRLWIPSNFDNEARVLPQGCRDAGLNDFVRSPDRFFLNISSHIQWYLDHGVEATAVILDRDQTIQKTSKSMKHCSDAGMAEMENSVGERIILEAIDKLDQQSEKPNLIMASYEMIVHLGNPYVLSIYKKLGIQSDIVEPIRDGNERYVKAVAVRSGKTRRKAQYRNRDVLADNWTQMKRRDLKDAHNARKKRRRGGIDAA